MNKRITVLLAVGILAIAGCFLAFRVVTQPYRLSQETFDQIQPGMTEEVVKSLIPFPDGPKPVSPDITHRTVASDGKSFLGDDGQTVLTSAQIRPKKMADGHVQFYREETGKLLGWVREWCDQEHRLDVLFDAQGRVVGRTLYRYKQGPGY